MAEDSVLRVLGGLDATVEYGPKRFRTKEGIVFKLRSVPPLLMADAHRRIAEPVPPKVYIADKDATEENPHDPAYQRALAEYRQTMGDVSNAILLTRGTEIEHLPDGVEGPDGTQWAEDVQDLAGVEVPSQGRRRYFCWMKYVALQSMDDFQEIVRKISRLGGVTLEQDVTEAANSFRDQP